MGRPKKVIPKRERVFNKISNAIDLIQIKWKKYIQITLSVILLGLFIYMTFFWIDTVAEIHFEIIYY
mgnify:FL=1